jgi:hypothetical protein
MPSVNERVAYRAFSGDTYEAVVTAVWHEVGAQNFRVDIDVTIPGVKEPWPLKAIRWYDDPKEPLPGARPRTA